MKYLYLNGDSFCGDGIEEGETYGELLADKYNLDIERDWWGGSSNHRIYRKTVNYIMGNQRSCPEVLQDTLFLIGWTKISRFEFYNSFDNKYIQLGHTNFYDFSGVPTHFPYPNTRFWKEYIKLFVDIKQMKREYIQMVFSLQSILQNYNCNYLFYNSFNDSVISQTDEIIDFKRWIKPRSSFDKYLNNFSREDVRMEIDDHPNELGHLKWFEVISSEIDSRSMI
mgnify:CR=1 FL=1